MKFPVGRSFFGMEKNDMEQGRTLVGASPAQAAGPRAVCACPFSYWIPKYSAPFQPPSPPTPPHRRNLTPYAGCYTCAENKQGSFSASGGGRCLEPQRKPAASSRVKPALGWEPNHTPPSPHLTSLYPGGSLPLQAPLDPSHSSSRQPFSPAGQGDTAPFLCYC